MISVSDLKSALERLAEAMPGVQDELCRADGELGDGDLGITVANGFCEAAKAPLPPDIGLAFLEVAKAFQRVSSSSYGTLMATGLMAAAKASKGKEALDPAALPGLIGAARDAMMARGKGRLGDKTVLDSLDDLAQALEGVAAPDMPRRARESVAHTVESFRPLINRLGRARMFGERSQGLADPGQLAFQRLVEALLPG